MLAIQKEATIKEKGTDLDVSENGQKMENQRMQCFLPLELSV